MSMGQSLPQCHVRLAAVGAITLDGKATRDEIFVDLFERVAALTAAGHTPGLGTVLVGDDPGSHAYVRGKHADCAKVGINSIRRDLPADINTGQARRDHRRAERQPPVRPATSSSCRCTNIGTRTQRSSVWIRARTPTACIRRIWAARSSTSPRRCRAPRAASSISCARTRSRSPALMSWSLAAA